MTGLLIDPQKKMLMYVPPTFMYTSSLLFLSFFQFYNGSNHSYSYCDDNFESIKLSKMKHVEISVIEY